MSGDFIIDLMRGILIISASSSLEEICIAKSKTLIVFNA